MSTWAKATPVTATFALPLTAYYIFLQVRVVYCRFRSHTVIGQESRVDTEHSQARPDPLLAAVRAQTNFLENVPLALILASLVETNGSGTSRKVLSWMLGSLFCFRVLHVEGGLMMKGYMGKGRPIGFLGTVAINAGLACWAAGSVLTYWIPGKR